MWCVLLSELWLMTYLWFQIKSGPTYRDTIQGMQLGKKSITPQTQCSPCFFQKKQVSWLLPTRWPEPGHYWTSFGFSKKKVRHFSSECQSLLGIPLHFLSMISSDSSNCCVTAWIVHLEFVCWFSFESGLADFISGKTCDLWLFAEWNNVGVSRSFS